MPAFAVPLSGYMSQLAQERFIQEALHSSFSSSSTPRTIAEVRRVVDDYYRPLVDRAMALYTVDVESTVIAGVKVNVVTPKGNIPIESRHSVLINLHGGSFSVGAGLGGLAESIPIASTGRIKVISVDYRMAPEFMFPAASEDVATVYKELLKTYKPQHIGLYGCSSGGMLTAQAIAWFRKLALPRPGAIGIFCLGADATFGGDSRYLSTQLNVPFISPPPDGTLPKAVPFSYFSEKDLSDPLAFPVNSPAVLAEFPPSLLITGTRDLGMSSVVYTHTQLVKAGVDAELHVWEGMWHNFLFEMDLPESKEAYDVIVSFFRKHLAKKRSSSRDQKVGLNANS